jgi:aspartyl-tRNA(Asn)/glutamyl-tRNA(Gln) amidotransferase subunit C
MPVQFTAADVRAIAGLAQLELDATQIELFVRQLGDFLTYAHEVLAVNTDGVAPTASVITRHEADRTDNVQPCLERAAALSNAPEPASEAGFFKVPRVIG